MASDYDKKKAIYDAYMKKTYYDPKVAKDMRLQLSYANTVDRDAQRMASKIFNQRTS